MLFDVLFAVVVTQAVSSEPLLEAAPVPGTKAWVVRVGPAVDVLDDRLGEDPLGPALRACLQGQAVGPVLPLVGGRGVVVASANALCAVRAGEVLPASELQLAAPWNEYAWPHQTPASRAFVSKLRRSAAPRQVERRWRFDWRTQAAADERALEVPGCGCALAVRPAGVVVLVDGGVDDRATTHLQAALGLVDAADGLSLAEADGGVLLRSEGDTYWGGCPAGDELRDEGLVRWSAGTRSLVAPAVRRGGHQPPQEERVRHRRSTLAFGPATMPDGGVPLDFPGGPLALVQGDGELVVLRDGGVDAARTREVRDLVRASCLDWPLFELDGQTLRSVEDTSRFGRCGGELAGCDLTLEYDPVRGRVVSPAGEPCARLVQRPPDGPDAEARARTCVAGSPDEGLAELALAMVLHEQGREAECGAHLELALGKGLPPAEQAVARRMLGSGAPR